MNFTREPIIETIISPKEGYKIVLRNSKIPSVEEISVDAVEIVSFGQALFYRSLEKSKCFLLPVTDYEVMEVRETRMVIKNASFEKNIKIGGGREHVKPAKEVLSEKVESDEDEVADAANADVQVEAAPSFNESRNDRKRDRRRNRRKRMHEERPENAEKMEAKTAADAVSHVEQHPENQGQIEGDSHKEKAKIPVPAFTGLIPPPPTLISETIAKYKEKMELVEKPRQATQHASSDEAQVSTIALQQHDESSHQETSKVESFNEENPE